MTTKQQHNFENIYRMCRKRGGYKSQNDAVLALNAAGYEISHASLKDYERDARIPQADTVIGLAEVYGTPELKWLHCSNSCELGEDLVKANPDMGLSDVYRTYYELRGVFLNVADLDQRIHAIIEDDVLTEDELPALEEILEALDRVTESAKELRIWAEKHRRRQRLVTTQNAALSLLTGTIKNKASCIKYYNQAWNHWVDIIILAIRNHLAKRTRNRSTITFILDQ